MTENDSGYRIDLNKIESFCYFWKNLWTPDTIRKPKLQIADTILFSNGKPHTWLFTSQQTGEIMRKKAGKLDSVASIVDYLKKKSNQFKGYKTHDLRAKIALIWFVRADKLLSSYLVGDRELGSILASELKEVIAIQTYTGGFAMKGNGIFSHRITRASNGQLIHRSHESLDSLTDPNGSCFTNKCKKLIILEQPISDRLKLLGTSLVRHLETLSTGEIEHLSFQVTFNSTWDPFLIAVRDVTLHRMPIKFYNDFDQKVFFDGIPPSFPPVHEQSSLLPSAPDPSLARNHSSSRTYDELDSGSNNLGTLSHAGKSQRGLDIITEDALEARRIVLPSQDTVMIPPPDLSHKASYFKATNEDYSLRKDRPELAFVATDEKIPLISRTESRSVHPANGRLSVFARAGNQPNASSNNIARQKHQSFSRTTSDHDFPDLQKPSIGFSSAMVEEFMQHRNAFSSTLSQSRPKSATVISRNQTSFSSKSKRYQSPTEGYCHRTTYQGEDLAASPKPLHSFFKVRRPISAPHRADNKTRINTLRRSIDYVSGSFRDKEDDAAQFNDEINRIFSFNSYDTVETADTIGGAAFWRQLPLSGKLCFGDYCWFKEQCNQYLDIRDQRHVVVNNSEGEVYFTEHNVRKTNIADIAKHLPENAQVGYKNKSGPFQIAFKSILLSRSECKFMGETLHAFVDSLVVRNKLANLEIGQIYNYFIRKHLNNLAQKCQEDARKFRITTVPQSSTDRDDLNAVYRRTIYHDALSTVHPSRFYYSVPVCECCYQIYLYMDELREEIILHNPDPAFLAATSPRSISSSSRPKSAGATLMSSVEQRKLESEHKMQQKKLRLIKEIEKFREELLHEDAELLKEEKLLSRMATSPTRYSRHDSPGMKKVSINTEFIPIISKDHGNDPNLQYGNQETELSSAHPPSDPPKGRKRPASAHAVLITPANHPDQTQSKVSKPYSNIPEFMIKSDGNNFDLVLVPNHEEEVKKVDSSEQPSSSETGFRPESNTGEDSAANQYPTKEYQMMENDFIVAATKNLSTLERSSPEFSFFSLPFCSSAPFLPFEEEAIKEEEEVMKSSKSSPTSRKKSRLEKMISRSRSRSIDVEEEEEIEKKASQDSLSVAETKAKKTMSNRINWDELIIRYDSKGIDNTEDSNNNNNVIDPEEKRSSDLEPPVVEVKNTNSHIQLSQLVPPSPSSQLKYSSPTTRDPLEMSSFGQREEQLDRAPSLEDKHYNREEELRDAKEQTTTLGPSASSKSTASFMSIEIPNIESEEEENLKEEGGAGPNTVLSDSIFQLSTDDALAVDDAPNSAPFDTSQGLSPISLFYFESSLNLSNEGEN